MEKFSVKITAAILSFVLMFTCVFTLMVSAEEYDYEYTDNNPIVSTAESFEETFSETKIKKVMYSYYVSNADDLKNTVYLAFTMRVGNTDYTAIAAGTVKSYILPSGATFVEGPIYGTMTINDYAYNITVGFSWLEETDNAMISVTLNGLNNSIVAFTFGENLIEGEILDFFCARMEKNNLPILNDDSNVEELYNGNYSQGMNTITSFPPIVLPYDPPTDEDQDSDLDLGANGEYEYQSAAFARWNDTTYKAFESNVYWNQSTNEMLVTFKPFVTDTNYFVSTLGYDFAYASLDSFNISIVLDANAPAANRGKIDNIYIPGLNNTSFNNSLNTEFVTALFYDTLSAIGIPTSTIEYALSRIRGRIYASNNAYDAVIEMELDSDSFVSDGLTHGLPFRFLFDKLNDTTYVGDTVYDITFTAEYCVLAQMNVLLSDPIYYTFYFNEETTHCGAVDIQ